MSRSIGKHMFIVFYDIKGVILSHAVPKRQSINTMYNSKVLRRDLMRALARKRPDGYEGGFILHQNNAPAQASQEVQTTIQIQIEAEVLTHSPYSPDLAPCDFPLFLKLKGELIGRHFNVLDELRSESTRILYSYQVKWFDQVYRQWIEQHRGKCLASQGADFEKN